MITTFFAEAALTANLNALPKSASDKYERLRRIAQRVRAMSDGLYEETQRAREARDHAVVQLSHFDRCYPPNATFEFRDDPQTGIRTRVPADFPERSAIVDRIETAKAELLRLQEEHAAAKPGFNLSDLEEWLAEQPRSAKFADARVAPKLAKDETPAGALLRNQEAQRRMTEELARVRNAPRTVAEAKALMRQQVAAMADQGTPGVGDLFQGRDVRWPTEQLSAACTGEHPSILVTTVRNASGLAIWAHRDAIIAALDAEIDRLGDDTNALSATDQALRIAELEAALLRLQREAEAIIERLEGDGAMVRRRCADPLVLLGIEHVRK